MRELFAATGAVILGKRTFALGLAPWGGTPFPVPCVVRTHEAREDQVPTTGTFAVVPEGIAATVRRAKAAAGAQDVLGLGGPTVATEAVRAGLGDALPRHRVPVLCGAGARLFADLGTPHSELEPAEVVASPAVTHLRFRVDTREPLRG